VLLICTEKMSSIVDWTDRSTCVLFGDGAGASVVRKGESEKGRILASYMKSDGSLAELLYRPAGGVRVPIDMSVLEERELPPEAKRSTMIFLGGIAVIMVLGMVEQLRPSFPDEAGVLVPLSTGVMIQIIMGVTATAIVLACKVNIKNVVTQSTMTSGLIGLIALFGIAWLADTWIGANEAQIGCLGLAYREYRNDVFSGFGEEIRAADGHLSSPQPRRCGASPIR